MTRPTEQMIYGRWVRHLVDIGRRAAMPTIENSVLLVARRRITEF